MHSYTGERSHKITGSLGCGTKTELDEKERGRLLLGLRGLGQGAGSCSPHVARVQCGIQESSEVVSKIYLSR